MVVKCVLAFLKEGLSKGRSVYLSFLLQVITPVTLSIWSIHLIISPSVHRSHFHFMAFIAF